MNNYCINCGKQGHRPNICKEPIISCGVICFKIENFPLKKLELYLYNKFLNIEEYNYKNINYLNKIDFHNNNIKFLLIQRKHSLSYIEFIRGRYNELETNEIKSICELMTKHELESIKTKSFEELWDNLWKATAKNKLYNKEMLNSKTKFNYLKNNNILDNLQTTYDYPEWGFPKGRRNKTENNYECAVREFIEETNLDNFNVFSRINSIEEVFTGTNNINYKHIYYIAYSEEENLYYSLDNYEIGNIGWFSLDEILLLLRSYNTTKKDIINQIYFFISVIINKII